VTNICFAGAGSNTAWVTSSGLGRLYVTEWPYPGLDLAFGA
jgi:gluconolactonase